MASRAEQLAERVEQGAQNLIDYVQDLTDEQWKTYCPNEKRTVGVLVHHVGSAYQLEAGAVTMLATDGAIPGVDVDMVDKMNAEHAIANADVTKEEAIRLVRENHPAAAEAVRQLTDEQLDKVAPTGLHWDAPLTVQFFVEHHPVGHPWIHLASIKAALK
jgi:hypothetical protein